MSHSHAPRTVALALAALTASAGAVPALQTSDLPELDYLEFTTLSRHHRVSIHGKNLDQQGQIHIAGIPAMVVPIPGTNAVKMNAYIPADVPFGPADVTVTTSAGVSNALTLDVVPRAPQGRNLWRFFMNHQTMIHRPQVGPDGTIYAKSAIGDLTAISPQGELEWLRMVGSDTTPAIDVGPDGTIYTGGGGPTIVAVNPDGTERWRWTDPNPNQGIVGGPNVGPDGNIYAVTHVPGLGLVSVDPQGELRWSGGDTDLYGPWGQLGQEIVFSDDQLFFCLDDIVESFDFDGERQFQSFTISQLPGNSPQMAVGPNGDAYVEHWGQLKSYAPGGALNWMIFGVGGSYVWDPDVGPDGTIYAKRNVFNTLHAVNPDGSTKWTYSHPEHLIKPVMSPAGDTLVIGGGTGLDYFYLGIGADGVPSWKVSMPVESPTPFTTLSPFPQGRPRFTPDGSIAYVMTASTSNSGGHSYVVAIQVGPIADVGHELAGANGAPSLQATGTLEGHAPLSFDLTGLQPDAPFYLVLGGSAAATPFSGGVVLPRADTVVPLVADASGSWQLTFNWPDGLPSNIATYWQVWAPDATAPQGWSASNALSLITP